MKDESRNTDEAHGEFLQWEYCLDYRSLQSCFLWFQEAASIKMWATHTEKHKLTDFGRKHIGPQILPFIIFFNLNLGL